MENVREQKWDSYRLCTNYMYIIVSQVVQRIQGPSKACRTKPPSYNIPRPSIPIHQYSHFSCEPGSHGP